MTRDADIARIAELLDPAMRGGYVAEMPNDIIATRLYDAGLRPSVEPAGLDVERLARALPEHYSTDRGAHHSCIAYAESIAAEYARLLPTQASDSPEKP